MAIKITENIKQGQINGGNRLNFVFINGISVNENENFVSTLNNDINDIDTEIEIKGLHSYTGYAVIENEVVNVTNYVLNTNTTTLTVERGLFFTIKSTHNINSKFYPVTYLDTLSEYTYEQKSDVSDSSLLSISLDTGTITLLDEPLNWATYNPNKKYDYKDYQKIFIFEGVNNEVVKTFEGVTSKKYDYKTSKKIKIEFKSSIYKEWKNGLNKSKMFYDNTIEEVLNYLYPDYKVEYLNGTDKNKLIKIKNMDLKNYTTHNNFLNALCRDRLIRLRFTTDNRILIVSDLYVSDLITDKDVYLDVVSIDDSSTDLVFNKITGTYRETSEYRNNEEYKRKYQDNEIDSSEDVKYVQFYKYKYFNTPLDVIKDYEFQTVNIDNIDTSILTYGDYVLLKAVDTGDVFNKDGIEIWGYVVDINNTTATITLGTSKVSWLNQRGYIDTIATNGDLTISNYRVYYGFYEMNIVNKYTISTTDGESKDYQMNLPVLPFVFYNNSTFLTQTIDENDEYCYVDGDWENIENYAKIGDEWVYLSGTYFDGTKTQCSITRGEFDTTPASHNTNDVVEVLKYNNMLINNNQFSFANLGDVKFSGLVSQIDGIWDIWFDNTQLKYNMEFTQDIPIYLYSNTITDNNNVIKYTGFDNHGISLKFERGNGENDFKVLIKNTLTTFKESELLTGVPINKLSSIIEVNKSLGEQIKAGDVLMLKEIKYGEPNYANYLSYKNVKWTVNTVEYNSTNDTYYLYLNNSFGSINDGVEFVVYPNSSIVMLQELYVRGNPVMYVEKNISLNTPESVERYGEKPYVITSTSHSETDIRLLIDYFKNGYKGLSPKNTRFKINTNVFGRYDIEVLDVVRITDTIYSNLNNQLAICINKKVSTNSVGIRQETLSFLTVGDYNVNPSNIELETTLTYTTNKIPYYNHVGSEINTSLSDINSSEVNSINTNINTAQSTADTALTTANTAQSTADSKNTIFRLPSNQTPQNQKIGDIWVKTDEEINNVFSWDGSAWIPTATNNSEKFKYGTIVNIGKDAVGSGKDGFSVTTGGFVNVENPYNKMYFEPTGESSYFMINVSQSEIANNNGSVKWQIGSVNDDSYIKYWFDSTENKDKLKISVDEFQLQGNNILRGLSFYYLVKDDTLPSGTSNSNMIEYEEVLVYATPYRFGAFNFVRSNKTTGTNISIQLKYVENYTVLKFIKNSNGNLFALIYNSTNYNLKLIKINSVYDNSTTNITELKDFGNTPIFTNKFTTTGSINNGNDLYFYVTDSNFNCVLYKFDTNNNTYISKNLNVEAVKILNFKNKIYLLTFGYLYRIDSSLNTEIITSNSPINIATTNNYLFLIYDFDIYYSGTGDSNSFTKLKELENNSFYYGYNSASYNLKTYIPISNGHALVVDDSLNAEEIFIQEKNFSFYSCSFGLFFIYEYNNLEKYGIGDVVSYNLTTKL